MHMGLPLVNAFGDNAPLCVDTPPDAAEEEDSDSDYYDSESDWSRPWP